MITAISNPATAPALTCARLVSSEWRPAHSRVTAEHDVALAGLRRRVAAGAGAYARLTSGTAVGVMRDRAVADLMNRQTKEAPKPIQGIVAGGVTDPPTWRRLAET